MLQEERLWHNCLSYQISYNSDSEACGWKMEQPASQISHHSDQQDSPFKGFNDTSLTTSTIKGG